MPFKINMAAIGKAYGDLNRKRAAKLQGAALGALSDVRNEALTQAREDIQQSGNFGSRWTEGLHGTIKEESPGVYDLDFTHDIPYFMVHQTGKTISGKPLLWIPLDFANDAQGLLARNYPGGLFRVDRKSGAAPLLLSVTDKQPKYFGKESVTLPKRFHVIEIIQAVVKQLPNYFRKRLRNG